MLDGLGLVYQGQEGTGAAAMANPKQSNLSEIASLVAQQGKAIAAARQKQGDDINADLKDLDLGNWDVQTKEELIKDRDAYVNSVTEIYKNGGNPKDITTDAGKAIYMQRQGLKQKIEQHKAQQTAYVQAITDFQKENAKAVLEGRDPVYNTEATLKNIEAWNNAASIGDRSKLDPTSILVLNEAPFDPYEIFKSVDSEDITIESGNETFDSKKQYSTIPQARTDSYIKTDKGKKDFEKGVKAGLWVDNKSMNKWMNDNKPKSKTVNSYKTKEPKSTSSSGLTDKDREEMGEPSKGMKMKVADKLINDPKGTKTPQTKDAELSYTYQTPNINLVTGNSNLINPKTGKPIGTGTGTSAFKDGIIGITIVDIEGKIIPINNNARSYYYKDSKGNTQKITAKTAQGLRNMIVAKGLGKNTVVFAGKNSDKQDAYAIASEVISESGESNLGKATKRVLRLQEIADELNSEHYNGSPSNTTTTTAKPTTQTEPQIDFGAFAPPK